VGRRWNGFLDFDQPRAPSGDLVARGFQHFFRMPLDPVYLAVQNALVPQVAFL
jgi:hypothetical protein